MAPAQPGLLCVPAAPNSQHQSTRQGGVGVWLVTVHAPGGTQWVLFWLDQRSWTSLLTGPQGAHPTPHSRESRRGSLWREAVPQARPVGTAAFPGCIPPGRGAPSLLGTDSSLEDTDPQEMTETQWPRLEMSREQEP